MPDSNEKPPARPLFRKLAWVIAAISFLCALVSVTGFMGDDDRLFGTLLFLFCGFVFVTIALTGYWSVHAAKEAATGLSGHTNLMLAMLCLLFFSQGLSEVIKPNFVSRLLGWVQIVAGGVGVIAGLVAFLAQRRQDKQRNQQETDESNVSQQ